MTADPQSAAWEGTGWKRREVVPSLREKQKIREREEEEEEEKEEETKTQP